MSNPNPPEDRVELCPRCKRILIELRNYDPQTNVLELGESSFTALNPVTRDIEDGLLSALIFVPLAWISSKITKFRHNRILATYPNSMFCAECGYVDKRRFKAKNRP